MRNALVEIVDSERAKKTFYPTPEPLAKKLLEGLDWSFIESILEPSAGKATLHGYAQASERRLATTATIQRAIIRGMMPSETRISIASRSTRRCAPCWSSRGSV